MLLAPILEQSVNNPHAFRMEERKSRSFVVEAEQIQFAANPA
jgi:hypothetical protein